MKKIITALTAIIMASCVGFTAHAAEMLDKDYIESEIWEEMWLGKGDDGTEYPEASYKHHLLDEWLNENYGSDDYNWTSIGQLKYDYKDYYNRLIKEWDFNDDRNGNWTIDAEDNSYRFQIIGGQWNMIWMDADKEYRTALEMGNLPEVERIGNNYTETARREAYDVFVYV